MSEKTRFWILVALLLLSIGFALFVRHSVGESFVNKL